MQETCDNIEVRLLLAIYNSVAKDEMYAVHLCYERGDLIAEKAVHKKYQKELEKIRTDLARLGYTPNFSRVIIDSEYSYALYKLKKLEI